MQIKRLTLTLPPRMKHTAHHDARAIAEALAQALHDKGATVTALTVQGQGQSGPALATRVGAAMAKGGSGHGG